MNEASQRLRLSSVPFPNVAGEIDLRGLVALLRRRARSILVTATSLMVISLLVVSQLEREYEATALLVVDSRELQLLGMEPTAEALGLNPVVDTEVEIARSPSVVSNVAEHLAPAEIADFLPRPSIVDRALQMLDLTLESPKPGAPKAWTDLSITEQTKLLENLSKQFDVRRLGLTKVISVRAKTKTPEMAAKLANLLTDAYTEGQIEAKLDSSQKAVSLLRDRVNQLASEIAKADDEVDKFVSTTLTERGTPQSQELLRRLEAERLGRAQHVSTLMGLDAALQAEDYTRTSELLDAASSDLGARQKELSDFLKSPKADSVQLELARSDLASIEKEIRTAAEKRAAELRVAISNSEQNTGQLRGQLDAILTRQDIPTEITVRFFQLQRDAETKRNLYTSFLTKLRQVEQQTGIDLPESRVIASARPSDKPSFPPTRLITAAAFLLSLSGAVGFALLREYYIGGFIGVEQLESAAGVPVIAAIPRYRSKTRTPIESAIYAEPLSAFAEAIRRTRLGIEALSQANRVCAFITSTIPEEGKTTVALALARSFALSQKKTLLIDADLRHPSVGKLANLGSQNNLIQYLSAGAYEGNLSALVTEPEPATGLRFIVGAEAGTDGTDLMLMSKRFEDVMSFARANFDVVIIDTSPIGLVVDAQIVARNTDVGVYVVRFASTNQNSMRMALRQLLRADPVQITCAVLNQVEGQEQSYGYY